MTIDNVMMIIFFGVCFLSTILIGIPWFRSWGFKKNGIYTQAEILEIARKNQGYYSQRWEDMGANGPGMKTMSPMAYRAVLRFKDSTGEEILSECSSRGAYLLYSGVGAKVPIVYFASKPSKCYLVLDTTTVKHSKIFFITAILCTGLFIFLLIMGRSRLG